MAICAEWGGRLGGIFRGWWPALAILGLLGPAGIHLPIISHASAAEPAPTTILEHFDRISQLRQGVRTYQCSSHHNVGGNADGNHYRQTIDGEHVLLDVKGPGCICRIWWTTPESTDVRIRLYFDGATTPLFDMTLEEFFSGTQAPFLAPLVGNRTVSSGGHYCYVPMPFREGCRIAITAEDEVNYYHVTYQRYADAEGVTTFTGLEDTSVARGLWQNAGTDPKPDTGEEALTGTVSLPADANVVLADLQGAGIIQQLEITFPGLAPGLDSMGLLFDLHLIASWDGSTEAAVGAPVGCFFGSGLGARTVSALPVGMDGERLYCYFPMPFGDGAVLRLVNASTEDVASLSYAVRYTPLDAPPEGLGRFHAEYRCEAPASPELDYVVLETNGSGHFVGLVQMIIGEDTARQYLEGDERIYVDGTLTPTLYGTGTEDFYNGGWYFEQGPFTLPVHGEPAHEPGWQDATSCYRFFLSDLIPFTTSIKVGIEHGPQNWICTPDICSVAFYYKGPNPTAVLTDELDLCNDDSETAHDYGVSGETWWGLTVGIYEGDEDGELSVMADYGRHIAGHSQFTVSIDPNNAGVLLRRRLDYRHPRQEARVYVDDALAGVWYDAGENPYLWWRDSEFMLPPALTQGKANVTLRLEAVTDSSDWTEYAYWVYTLLPACPSARALTVKEINGSLGEVVLDPPPSDANAPTYPPGTQVLLLSVPIDGDAFSHWEIQDPNHPGDANYVVIDANNPLLIVLDADRCVTAVFRCGTGLAWWAVPITVLLGVIVIRRFR